MPKTHDRAGLRALLAAVAATVLVPATLSYAQESEPDPGLEEQALDVGEGEFEAVDEAPDEGPLDDEAADVGPGALEDEPDDGFSEDRAADEEPLPEADEALEEETEAASDGDAEYAGDYVEDTAEWTDEGAWQSVPLAEGEDWAADVVVDESEAAIQLDRELNPTGEAWEAVESGDFGSGPPQEPARSRGDTNRWSDVPVVRPPVRRAPSAAAPATGRDTPYSIGGKAVGDQGVPWQAQIYYPFSSPNWAEELRKGTPLWSLQHECGGTLIADDWVLTAAHCIDEEMVRKGYRVRLGATDLAKGDGLTYRIERIVRHSGYASRGQEENGALPPPPNMYADDIALVRIAADGQAPRRDPARIRPIPLHAGPLPKDTPVSATGWGKTVDVTNYQRSAVLMRVDLQVMDTLRCAQLPGYGPKKIHGKVICAAKEGRATCAGDSGGAITPTTGAPVVVGIVSWGKGRCSGDGQPGIYTRVASYREWIEQAMRLPPTRNALP